MTAAIFVAGSVLWVLVGLVAGIRIGLGVNRHASATPASPSRSGQQPARPSTGLGTFRGSISPSYDRRPR